MESATPVRPSLPLALKRLRAIILLGGSVRVTGLTQAISRPLLDLPIDDSETVLSVWQQQITGIRNALDRPDLPARLLIDRAALMPTSHERHDVPLEIERDPSDYRGTAGLVYDVTRSYLEDDYILIVNAAQILMQPLLKFTEQLAALEGDVSVVSHKSGQPTGIILLRVGVLADVPRVGFVDLKEQALPKIAQEHTVKVLSLHEPSGLPVRTLTDYLYALRQHHLRRADEAQRRRLLEEEWRPVFSIVESGAEVGENVTLHDSVILKGGRVESSAVLVRSVVPAGRVIKRGKVVVDTIVDGSAGRSK